MSAPCHCKHVDDSSSNDKLSALSPELQQEFKDPNHPANLIGSLVLVEGFQLEMSMDLIPI